MRRFVDLISAKRSGVTLSGEEISGAVHEFVAGNVPDYQMSAFLMAVCWQGMTDGETSDLTMAMVDSGARLDLSDIAPLVADKHSTGGVGDKTTLVVAPLVAHLGLPVGKMSGRGLGFTGGTLDKLESFPGFRSELSVAEFRRNLERSGIVVCGQSADLAPADGLLYALRDVTATVESIPLIASSVMSKKIAAGATVIALDVKTGNGAFMKRIDDARRLADLMVAIGRAAGRHTVASVTSMDQPLGMAVGNVLEVREAIDTLKGKGPADFHGICVHFAAELLHAAGLAGYAESRSRAERALSSGEALAKLGDLVESQGGDRRDVEDASRLESAPTVRTVTAPSSGFIQSIDTEGIGVAAARLGAGREKKGDAIDHRVGFRILLKVGDSVRAGDVLADIYAASDDAASRAAADLTACYVIDEDPVPKPNLLLT